MTRLGRESVKSEITTYIARQALEAGDFGFQLVDRGLKYGGRDNHRIRDPQSKIHNRFLSAALMLICLAPLALAVGCGSGSQPANQEVVVYTALDQEFSKPIFDAFTRQTGITVKPKFDGESTKTTGLVSALIAEKDRPRCDVFWNNEALHTLRLKELGMLAPYPSPAAADYPADAQGPAGAWHGFAARARVLIVNTNIIAEARRPDSINDIIDAQWYDRVGVAKPLFGTTATHAACLFVALGEGDAKDFFEGVKRNARILSGNRQVARAVASGQLAFGLTDTDDAMLEVEAGAPVTIIYPDQDDDQLGTLFIPNTLAILKDCPNPGPARQLVDYLLSPDVEGRLVMGPSAQIPLNKRTTAKPRVETPATVKPMQVDFAEAAQAWDKAAEFLREEFTAAQ
ncbi:putative binding protein component of ABC iron transporter precursor [Posidoniimonas corsicana]|uniref:Putative binding protein component of ABC iron transporter n=1 Tax=Posidoniimonas corsicana TaxID=1938618 RepID=A0A5C5UVB5_9BACT|nr:extracellular solute-binding protein [Posidoniimonas corsicana]TWT30326.1 putative binding protein component of ABC iron transporter precursor [Posidoniimonas corsicana]